MKVKFISEKTQSKIVLTFVGIAVIFFMLFLCIQPYKWIDPQDTWSKIGSLFLCMFVFLLLAALLTGIWVKGAIKIVDDKEEKTP